MYEEEAIRLIKERERMLRKLQHALAKIPRGETDPETAIRRQICNHLLDLRAFSVFVVESISKWQRASGLKIRAFIWETRDYLLKMVRDTDFIETYSYVAETLCVQGTFSLSFAPLRERPEDSHAMLVRSGHDVVHQEELLNLPSMQDEQRLLAVLEFLRLCNERVRFKDDETHHRYDVDASLPSSTASTLLLLATDSRGLSSSFPTPEERAQSHSLGANAAQSSVGNKQQATSSARGQNPVHPDPAMPRCEKGTFSVTAAAATEVSFDELDFSLDDGDGTLRHLLPPAVARAKLVVGDSIVEKDDHHAGTSAVTGASGEKRLDKRPVPNNKKNTELTRCASWESSSAQAIARKRTTEATPRDVINLAALERDTLLHIFRCIDHDDDDRIGVDDVMEQFQGMEVRPLRQDLESLYLQHANLFDRDTKVCVIVCAFVKEFERATCTCVGCGLCVCARARVRVVCRSRREFAVSFVISLKPLSLNLFCPPLPSPALTLPRTLTGDGF